MIFSRSLDAFIELAPVMVFNHMLGTTGPTFTGGYASAKKDLLALFPLSHKVRCSIRGKHRPAAPDQYYDENNDMQGYNGMAKGRVCVY